MTNKEHIDTNYDEELCIFYFEIEDFDCAKRISNELLANDDQNYTALLVNGLIEEEQGNYADAIACYNNVLEIYPDDPQALKRKALSELFCKNETQALDDINKSIEHNPKDPDSYIIRGMIQFQSYDRKKEAIINYNQALKIDPQNVYGLFNRGLTFLRIGNKQYAYDDLSKAAKLGHEEAQLMIKKYFPKKHS